MGAAHRGANYQGHAMYTTAQPYTVTVLWLGTVYTHRAASIAGCLAWARSYAGGVIQAVHAAGRRIA